MLISFILPPASKKVVGGLKIIYQYSNYLAANDCDVCLYYRSSGKNSKGIPEFIVRLLRKSMLIIEPKWFKLDHRIKKKDFKLPSEIKGDVVVASDLGSAFYGYKSNVIKKCYFIQDFENWTVSDDEVYKTYNYGMKNIVVSNWLKKIVDSQSHTESTYIPNGIDLGVFRITNPIDKRGHSIAMLYHNDKRKGCDVGLKVIYRLKKKYPDLVANLFGSPQRPDDFPDWINYTQSASQKQVAGIDNQSSIFLCPSRQEGYGLTGLEGIACGCALVTTDCKGVKEYAIDGKNALMCSVDDIDELYNCCCRLLDDIDFRIKITNNGIATSKKYDIKDAKKKFLETVVSI